MDAKILHELFECRDGILYWKVTRPHTPIKPGDKVGGLGKNGYLMTCINSKRYYNHRIIFMMNFGYLPKFIDHIDNNKTNNNPENLREASSSENNRNTKLKTTNTSGVKGVSWSIYEKKWRARITVDGKEKSIGYFLDLEKARLAIKQARKKYHGEFACHE